LLYLGKGGDMKKVLGLAGLAALIAVIGGLGFTAFHHSHKIAPTAYTARQASDVFVRSFDTKLASGGYVVASTRCAVVANGKLAKAKTGEHFGCVAKIVALADPSKTAACGFFSFDLSAGSQTPTNVKGSRLTANYCA
jgi:hypothetical protein